MRVEQISRDVLLGTLSEFVMTQVETRQNAGVSWWTWRELNPRLPNPTFPIASTRSSAKYGITIKRNKSRYDDFAATGQPL